MPATGQGANMLVASGAGVNLIVIVIVTGNGASLIFAGSGQTSVFGGAGSMRVEIGSGTGSIAEGVGQAELDLANGSAGGQYTVTGFRPGTDTIGMNGSC